MNISYIDSKLFIASGENIICYETTTEEDSCVKVPAPTLSTNAAKEQFETSNKEEAVINSLAISRNQQYIAVSTENKQIVVYDMHLNSVKNFMLNRIASKLLFSKDGDIVVADKTGDVYLYKFNDDNNKPLLLLGHLSTILDIIISNCGRYIISCDRDEKIRVSRFPNAYNIESYCLGHKEFVTAIKLLSTNILVSASGDGTIRFWNYIKGDQLNVIDTNAYLLNKNLLNSFSKQMDNEKVDVEALPITEMQTFEAENVLLIAVSLHNFNGIQLYKSNVNNCSETSFFKCIELLEAPYNFVLSDNLMIFDSHRLFLYNFVNGDYVGSACNKLEQFYQKYRNTFNFVNDNAITVLYKRKYDNVQEYMERKKLRLETSNQ